MPILDLAGAKPLFPQLRQKPRKRTLGDAGTMPPNSFRGGGSPGGFAAAKLNRLTMDFAARTRSADQDLFGDNIKLRARARSLAIDNPFARKFLAMCVQNVVGPAGVLMQAKITGANGRDTAETKAINKRIEQEWKRWCRVGRCTADGKYSFAELQQMAIKNAAREGENLIQFVYGKEFNDTAFALNVIDNDQLDDTLIGTTGENEIRMGVEVNKYRRPVAYHVWNVHPFDPVTRQLTRNRLPAEDVVHSAIWERPNQTRGYTWMSSAILSMNQYARYEEAVTVAARASAAKFLVIEQDLPEGWSPDDEDYEGEDRNSDGTEIMTANAGEIPRLYPGERAEYIDPKFPTTNHGDFTRTTLRNIASALLVSYPTLGNDLEGVNFSSIRAGMLDERDCWRIIQRWFIDHFLEPIFQAWLKMALLTTLKDITLTPAQCEMVAWKARGWDWVDPLKDAQAIVLKLQNGLITYADALASLGLDFEETMTERAFEQAFIEALGVMLGTDIRGVADTADDAGDGTAADQTATDKTKKDSKRTLQRISRAIELMVEMREAA